MKHIFGILWHIIRENKSVFYRIIIKTIFCTLVYMAAFPVFMEAEKKTTVPDKLPPSKIYVVSPEALKIIAKDCDCHTECICPANDSECNCSQTKTSCICSNENGKKSTYEATNNPKNE